ncbi:MAG: hypothetical protein UX06_C0032G0009 [Candidatus Giovannonibacteria bacterium GW2011_GWA2_45_21]|uniref:Uncharacterized protein n=1 Tax=Candidatus Giovannonibacteria bacterium GW2011_GWA2_45_21 TaxID=1618649 RepID=A0A0G1M6F4_9BACT|nr:MAG: hypothetical protein UX06_C0032G0009 [Candidatus Giovannonibacteria bacterium GW2011_GWA2_45_21]
MRMTNATRNGDFSVAVYDKIRVFKYLPRSFHKKRQEKSEPDGPSSSDEPQKPVKRESVDHMGKRVPVGNMLGVFRAKCYAVPEFYIPALANENLPHQVERERENTEKND